MKNNEYVILIHGLARTHRSWGRMARSLTKNGYHVINLAYPSRKSTIEELSNTYLAEAVKTCQIHMATRIHFVTHSMGGILVRHFLAHHSLDQIGHIVMLSPPNQGSELIDKLGKISIFSKISGPAGQQLGTTSESLPNRLGPVNYSVGVITGNRTINPVLSILIPGENDGKVSVKSARLTGISDFLVVPQTHPMIMHSRRVIQQTYFFLDNGEFSRN